MNRIRIAAALLAVGMAAGAHAQSSVWTENFDNVAGLSSAGWVFNNLSTPASQNWFQGNSGVFSAQGESGAPGAYAAVNFNSTSSATGAIDNWLITPELTLGAGSMLSFYTRAGDAGFLDQLEVRFSSGSSTNISGFTTLLGTVGSSSSSSYPTDGWMLVQYALPADMTAGRIGFRYAVANAQDAGYVGLDSMTITAVPEPASALLLGLGVCGIVGRLVQRRRNVN